jgi:hypothetical protein
MMNTRILLALCVLAMATLRPAALGAQPVVRLDRPAATLEEPFSSGRGIRELSSGKLLIADFIEQRVVLADFASGTVREVVREGAGPQEVRLPQGLVPHLGDSTLLIDVGNGRVTLLAPDGRAVRSIPSDRPGVGGVRGVDARGRFYFAVPSWAEGPNALVDDSVRVVRWMPGTEDVEQVAVVQSTRWRKDRSPAMTPRIPTVGYAGQDAWVVGADGAIAIVRANPYRMEFIGADGTVARRGAPVTTPRRPVTVADKERFVRAFGAGAVQSGRGENGGMGRPPAPSDAEVAQQVTTTEWATHHPPFEASGVFAAPGGRTWVRLPSLPGERVRYDVFGANGERERQVELRAGRRVALVGVHGVYVVAEDADGVQVIELYRLP